MKIYDYNGKKNLCGNRISRIEIGTRFVADYEVKVLAKVLNVPLEWLLEED